MEQDEEDVARSIYLLSARYAAWREGYEAGRRGEKPLNPYRARFPSDEDRPQEPA